MHGELTAEITVASDQQAMQRIQAFKYQVYVEELGRYGEVADHQAKLLVETDDATSRNLLVEMAGKLVATARLTWGGDQDALHHRQIDQYDLAPVLNHVPPDQIVICERLMIAREFRGGDLLMQLFNWMMRPCPPAIWSIHHCLGQNRRRPDCGQSTQDAANRASYNLGQLVIFLGDLRDVAQQGNQGEDHNDNAEHQHHGLR